MKETSTTYLKSEVDINHPAYYKVYPERRVQFSDKQNAGDEVFSSPRTYRFELTRAFHSQPLWDITPGDIAAGISNPPTDPLVLELQASQIKEPAGQGMINLDGATLQFEQFQFPLEGRYAGDKLILTSRMNTQKRRFSEAPDFGLSFDVNGDVTARLTLTAPRGTRLKTLQDAQLLLLQAEQADPVLSITVNLDANALDDSSSSEPISLNLRYRLVE